MPLAVIKMKMKITIICILLFCCARAGTETAQESVDHLIIPDGGRIEFNATPIDDGNRTMLIAISFPKSDVHTAAEIDLIPGHVYFVRVMDMGIVG